MELHAFKKSRFLVITAFSALYFIVLTIFLVTSPKEFHSIATEDGPIESLSAILFLLAFAGFIVAAKRSDVLRKQNSRCAYIMIALWAALALFSAGEEISWGQRILGTDLPDSMKVSKWGKSEGAFTNIQNETNFHNMAIIDDTVGNWRLTLIAALGTSIILPLASLFKVARQLFRKLFFPVPPIDFWLLGLGAYLFQKFGKSHAHVANNVAETFEMTLGLIFFLFAMFAALHPNDVFIEDKTADKKS